MRRAIIGTGNVGGTLGTARRPTLPFSPQGYGCALPQKFW
jgi:hypothetical protein